MAKPENEQRDTALEAGIDPDYEPAANEDGELPVRVLTVNQVVAYNITRARQRTGKTQRELAESLTRLTGRRWSNVTVSAAERSFDPTVGRVRQFDADELIALARAFGMPLLWFLLPPDDDHTSTEYAFALGRDADRRWALSGAELLELLIPSEADEEAAQFFDRVDAAADFYLAGYAAALRLPSEPAARSAAQLRGWRDALRGLSQELERAIARSEEDEVAQ